MERIVVRHDRLSEATVLVDGKVKGPEARTFQQIFPKVANLEIPDEILLGCSEIHGYRMGCCDRLGVSLPRSHERSFDHVIKNILSAIVDRTGEERERE